MPRILQHAPVQVYYELQCSFERATALAKDTYEQLKDEGVTEAKDVSIGWDRWSIVRVGYNSLTDAARLDPKVREMLSRKVDFTYESTLHNTYGSRGPSSYVTATTSIQER